VSLYLHGLGHFHPENVISNRFLEELDIGTTDAWILERVGIRERRTLLPLDYIKETRNRDLRMATEVMVYGNAETGRRAAEMAIARAGVAKADIGMVISGSSACDMVTPADACTIAAALGLEVPCFDVNSACTSFHVAMHLLSMMDPQKVPRFVLSVVPEGVTRTVNYSDRASAVLWGDGTSAAVLSTRERGRAEILGTSLESSPAGHDKVTIPRTGHFLQEGRTVQTFAIRKTAAGYRRLREAYAQEGRRLHFVGHQANLMMLEKVCEMCEVPPPRHHHNVESYGNTAGAGSMGVVSMRWDEWTDADDVAVAGVGAGLTWSSFLLRFGDCPAKTGVGPSGGAGA
jgi:3-oxoacyl-[acyl-carrier-protein] synthase III